MADVQDVEAAVGQRDASGRARRGRPRTAPPRPRASAPSPPRLPARTRLLTLAPLLPQDPRRRRVHVSTTAAAVAPVFGMPLLRARRTRSARGCRARRRVGRAPTSRHWSPMTYDRDRSRSSSRAARCGHARPAASGTRTRSRYSSARVPRDGAGSGRCRRSARPPAAKCSTQPLVRLEDERLVEHPARDARLVGDDHQLEAGPLQDDAAPRWRTDTGAAVDPVDVAVIDVQGPVAIDQDCGSSTHACFLPRVQHDVDGRQHGLGADATHAAVVDWAGRAGGTGGRTRPRSAPCAARGAPSRARRSARTARPRGSRRPRPRASRPESLDTTTRQRASTAASVVTSVAPIRFTSDPPPGEPPMRRTNCGFYRSARLAVRGSPDHHARHAAAGGKAPDHLRPRSRVATASRRRTRHPVRSPPTGAADAIPDCASSRRRARLPRHQARSARPAGDPRRRRRSRAPPPTPGSSPRDGPTPVRRACRFDAPRVRSRLARIRAIPPSLRHAGAGHHPRRPERVGEQHDTVEPGRAHALHVVGERASPRLAARRQRHHLVHALDHRRHRRDASGRRRRQPVATGPGAQGAPRRQRHHDVTKPVGEADEGGGRGTATACGLQPTGNSADRARVP